MMTGLYIHIPFCVSKCRYCDFYRLTNAEQGEVDLFIRCLMLELQRLPSGFAPQTVFVGGGTPTSLDQDNFSALFSGLNEIIDLSQVTEFSCEVNPGTLTDDLLGVMKAGGVNRVSMGVQSFNDHSLKLLGRIHTASEARAGFKMLQAAGFDQISLDLIQSVPGMSMADVLADVRAAVALGPDHLSCYNLIYEPNTPLSKELAEGKLMPPTEDEEADIYFAVKNELALAGYKQYEISNFCRSDQVCHHNLLYWQGGSYFGCGPSAHSHWAGARFGNVANLEKYCERLLSGKRPFDEIERLGAKEKARETLVMGLRLVDGIDLQAFEQSTGFNLLELGGEMMELFINEGLLRLEGGRLRLDSDSLFVSNAVFSELV